MRYISRVTGISRQSPRVEGMLQGLAADSRPDGFQQLHIRCAAAQHFSQLYAFLAGQTGPQETGGRQRHRLQAVQKGSLPCTGLIKPTLPAQPGFV